jgi:hypothetical protein
VQEIITARYLKADILSMRDSTSPKADIDEVQMSHRLIDEITNHDRLSNISATSLL